MARSMGSRFICRISRSMGHHTMLSLLRRSTIVYAFDADGRGTSALWTVNLGPSVLSGDGLGISPEVGITSTPVIDPSTNTIYVFAITRENGNNIYRLHALDVLTGNERPNSPRLVDATASG